MHYLRLLGYMSYLSISLRVKYLTFYTSHAIVSHTIQPERATATIGCGGSGGVASLMKYTSNISDRNF